MNNVLTLSIIMGLYSRASKMRVYAEVLLGEENALHDGISWSLLFQYHHRHLWGFPVKAKGAFSSPDAHLTWGTPLDYIKSFCTQWVMRRCWELGEHQKAHLSENIPRYRWQRAAKARSGAGCRVLASVHLSNALICGDALVIPTGRNFVPQLCGFHMTNTSSRLTLQSGKAWSHCSKDNRDS